MSTLHSLTAAVIPLTKLVTCSSFHRVRRTPIRRVEPSRLSEKETSDSAAIWRDVVGDDGAKDEDNAVDADSEAGPNAFATDEEEAATKAETKSVRTSIIYLSGRGTYLVGVVLRVRGGVTNNIMCLLQSAMPRSCCCSAFGSGRWQVAGGGIIIGHRHAEICR